MVFVNVRITLEFLKNMSPEALEKDLERTLDNLWSTLNDRFHNPLRATFCYEYLNKFGEETKPHIHYNCELREETIETYHEDGQHDLKRLKDNHQTWFRRSLGLSGGKAYCIQIHADVGDVNRWWRYTMKERLLYHVGFTSQDHIDALTAMAKDERSRQIELNLASRSKAMDKNQFRDIMFKHLLDTMPHETNRKKLFCAIGKYYQSKSKTPPFNKLLDVVLDYLIFAKHLTFEAYFDEKYSA